VCNGCVRIKRFSSATLTYRLPGTTTDVATGSAATEDNARVINDRRVAVSGFSTAAGGEECFPAHATVRLEDGRVVRMSDVHIGDKVQAVNGAGELVYSEVYAWLDRSPTAVTEYINFHLDGHTNVLQVTPAHMVFVNKNPICDLSSGTYMRAREVSAGWYLCRRTDAALQPARISAVSVTVEDGAYAPDTMTGNVVVNGVLASTYATVNHQQLAYWAMVPLRVAYFCLPTGWVSSSQDNGVHWYASMLSEMALSEDGVLRKYIPGLYSALQTASL